MKNYTFNFEVQTLLEQFVGAFNDIIIKRYDNNKTVLPSSSAIKVDFVYAPKQRVYDTLNTPAPGGLTVPVVAVNIAGISRDAKRVFNKLEGFYIETGDNSDGSLIKKIPQPVPVNIGINMTIVTKLQSDMDQIVSNFVPYCDPYIIISWKLPNPKNPNNPYEIRSEVLWDGNIQLNYPDNLAGNQPYRLTATTNFTIKGWLFKKMDDVVKKIYTIDSKFISSDGTTSENDVVSTKPSIIKDFNTVFGVNQGITVTDFSIQTTAEDIKNFKNTYSTVYGLSGGWEFAYDWVQGNSTPINNAVLYIQSNSGIEINQQLASNYVIVNSARFEDSYTTVNTLSSDWEMIYTYVTNNSGIETNQQAVATLVNTNSAFWNFAYSNTNILSSNFDSLYSIVNANSSITWNYQGTDLKNLSSGWVGGHEAYTNLIYNSALYLAGNDFSLISETSANWNSVYTNVNRNSSNWIGGHEAYTNLISNSGFYLLSGSNVDLNFLSVSANWESVYTNVELNSATWIGGNEAYTNLITNSAAYLSGVDLSFLGVSGNWNSVYSTVLSNSSNWNYQGLDIKALTASWIGGNEAYTNLILNSSTYLETPVYGTVEQIIATPSINNSVVLSLPISIVTPGDLNVTGSLFVNGTAANINSLNLSLSDSLIYLGEGNISNVVDIGFVGNFTPAPSSYQHTGLVRVARDNKWTLFSGVTAEPTTVVDFSSGYNIDTLRANIEGTLFGNVSGNVSGNAGSVTNGVYTNGSYSDPSWIISLADSKIQGPNRDSWDSVYSYVNQNSGIEENQSLATTWVIGNSANSQSVYSTVLNNSATTWNYQGTDVKILSGNWQSTYTLVSANSTSWNNVYTTVQSNSAIWGASSTGGYTIQSLDFNVIVGQNYLVNTLSNTVVGTLPSSPNIGDKIDFADPYGTWGSNPFILNNNGNPIQSINEGLTANLSNYSFRVIYVDLAQGWKIF